MLFMKLSNWLFGVDFTEAINQAVADFNQLPGYPCSIAA